MRERNSYRRERHKCQYNVNIVLFRANQVSTPGYGIGMLAKEADLSRVYGDDLSMK